MQKTPDLERHLIPRQDPVKNNRKFLMVLETSRIIAAKLGTVIIFDISYLIHFPAKRIRAYRTRAPKVKRKTRPGKLLTWLGREQKRSGPRFGMD